VVEAWEDIGNSTEVFYIHGIMTISSQSFLHLDGASMHFDLESKARLFHKGRKLKGHDYNKHFRLDGCIGLLQACEVVRAYLPIEELTDEAFDLVHTDRGARWDSADCSWGHSQGR
jgi:hypothetical protein